MAKSDLKKLLQSTDKAELISLFFKYMVESFGIDTITSCLKGVLPATSEIVNPEYKELIAGQKKVSTLLKDCKVKYTE
ncbi:MAG: hypothetical protein LBG96_14765, partial [Tannerella sp.]|nr:hypothetical protein [Tannerella sp.]